MNGENGPEGSIHRWWTPARILAVVLGTLTAEIHTYIGATTGAVHFLVMAVGLLAGVVVFFTVYWGPILYWSAWST